VHSGAGLIRLPALAQMSRPVSERGKVRVSELSGLAIRTNEIKENPSFSDVEADSQN
jgi:hypothetical protein